MKRRVLVVGFVLIMALVLGATPAMACDCRPWCGDTYTQGYWKNHLCETGWMGVDFGSPSGGDYKQIFANQALAFHYNWVMNDCCGGVRFQQTFYRNPCRPCWNGKSIAQIYWYVTQYLQYPERYSREKTLEFKCVLDEINNGCYIWAGSCGDRT